MPLISLQDLGIPVIGSSSVSGFSSGGFFAVQMQVAFSSYFMGAGIFAGGPFDCAQGNVTVAGTKCSTTFTGPNVNTLVANTATYNQSHLIDDPAMFLATDFIYMFEGGLDLTVAKPVMNALYQYYIDEKVPAANILYETMVNVGHTFPTNNPNNSLCPCSLPILPPYISNCGFDGAGAALQQIYKADGLNPPNTGNLSGQIYYFNQSEFAPNGNPSSVSLDAGGYVYIPSFCLQFGLFCSLHVSFHGCIQGGSFIDSTYVTNTGFLPWADSNNIVVLFPQAIPSVNPKNCALNGLNLFGCWDWWGYLSSDTTTSYPTNQGAQMLAIKAMIDRIGA